MITIVPYQSTWQDEFQTLKQTLHQALGNLAVRIDHIGSTAVPSLAAKDIIDIQITVESLNAAIEAALMQAGYQRLAHITQDHLPPGYESTDDWMKWIFRPIAPHRPVNVHIRLPGQANQRYALLFRDYLRAQPAIAQAYAAAKLALAKYHPDDLEAYYDVKDPVCDIIIGGAEIWATATGWQLER
jgi:GrpB-like predicted nucleotidyltransferase (UPF0157 family)